MSLFHHVPVDRRRVELRSEACGTSVLPLDDRPVLQLGDHPDARRAFEGHNLACVYYTMATIIEEQGLKLGLCAC